MVTECNEAFGNKHSCCMANLEVFVSVPDLLLSRRYAPGQKRKSGTKTKNSKFAMQQIYLPSRLSLSRTRKFPGINFFVKNNMQIIN